MVSKTLEKIPADPSALAAQRDQILLELKQQRRPRKEPKQVLDSIATELTRKGKAETQHQGHPELPLGLLRSPVEPPLNADGLLFEIWKSLTDPDRLIHLLAQVVTGWLGYALLAGVVFAESGLLIGLFLPGDSLLFTVGVVAGAGELDIVQICVMLAIASILGDQCGYFLKAAAPTPAIFSRPDFALVQAGVHVTRHAGQFYEHHGGKTLIYAKFVPVVRRTRSYMAGVGEMSYTPASFRLTFGADWAGSSP